MTLKHTAYFVYLERGRHSNRKVPISSVFRFKKMANMLSNNYTRSCEVPGI